MKDIKPQSKYDSFLYNIQINHYVKNKGIKLIQNNKKFPPQNFINGKQSPYGIKGVIINYNYRENKKLGQRVVAVRIITWSGHAYQT